MDQNSDLKFHYIAYDKYTLPPDPAVVVPEPADVLIPLLHQVDQQFIDDRSLVCGNQKGIELVIDHSDQKNQLEEIKASILKLRADMEGEISVLKKASIGYKAIRGRFLDCYKRDELGMRSRKIRKSIKTGNKYAHRGDPVTDATLYTSNARSDMSTFLSLYGLRPHEVEDLASVDYIINTLSEYGSRRANGKMNADIDRNFKTFVDAVQAAVNVPDTLDPVSPIGLAHICFWQSVRAAA